MWLRLTSQYQTYRSIAHRLCIGFGTVVRTLKHFEETGDVSQCTSHTRRPQLHILDDYHEMFIIGLALECPTTHLQEFCEVIYRATRVKVSIPTVCRILRRYGLTRKKVQRIAFQRSSSLRGMFMAHMFLYNRRVLVWLDETGSDRRTFLRKCGYAIRGERAIKHTLLSRGKRINAIIALSSSGIIARYLTEGTVDTNITVTLLKLLNTCRKEMTSPRVPGASSSSSTTTPARPETWKRAETKAKRSRGESYISPTTGHYMYIIYSINLIIYLLTTTININDNTPSFFHLYRARFNDSFKSFENSTDIYTVRH